MYYDILGELSKARLPRHIFVDNQTFYVRGIYGILYCLSRRKPISYLIAMQYANIHPFNFKYAVNRLVSAKYVKRIGNAIKIIDYGDTIENVPVDHKYIHTNFLIDKNVDLALKGMYFTALAMLSDGGFVPLRKFRDYINSAGYCYEECIKELFKLGVIKKNRGALSIPTVDEVAYRKNTSVNRKYAFESISDGLNNAHIYRDVEVDSKLYLKVSYYYRFKWKMSEDSSINERSIIKFSLHCSNLREECSVKYIDLSKNVSDESNWVDDFIELYPTLSGKRFIDEFNKTIEAHKWKLILAEKDIRHKRFFLT